MSKITAELLRQMVGVKTGRPLIDKLVDPLNLVLPAYGITTEYRIAAFLATAAPESDWFKTLREYGKGEGHPYGRPDKRTGLIYYGRGIFQNTWYAGYLGFTEYVAENWENIKDRAAQYGHTEAPDFTLTPELLATPYWAVEAACWYWKVNGLEKYANRGLKGFFGLEGKVNRGRDDREALQYPDRLRSYETARRLIADDFNLDSAAAPSNGDSANLAKQETDDRSATQPSPSLTDAPVETREQTSIQTKVDAIGDKVQSINQTAEKFQVPSMPAGLGTKLSVFWKQVIVPVIMAFWGWVSGHWQLCLIIAIIAIALGTFEWIENRKRNNPQGAVPAPVDPNVTPWWRSIL